jgi:hypothetical protein
MPGGMIGTARDGLSMSIKYNNDNPFVIGRCFRPVDALLHHVMQWSVDISVDERAISSREWGSSGKNMAENTGPALTQHDTKQSASL